VFGVANWRQSARFIFGVTMKLKMGDLEEHP
jgi:hypothetical protein